MGEVGSGSTPKLTHPPLKPMHSATKFSTASGDFLGYLFYYVCWTHGENREFGRGERWGTRGRERERKRKTSIKRARARSKVKEKDDNGRAKQKQKQRRREESEEKEREREIKDGNDSEIAVQHSLPSCPPPYAYSLTSTRSTGGSSRILPFWDQL